MATDGANNEAAVPANAHSGSAPVNGALVAVDQRGSTLPALPWSYAPPTRPEILSARPGPVELFHALRRRWMLASGVGLAVGAVLAAIVWFILPVRYEAEALLRVAQTDPVVFNQPTGYTNDDYDVFKRSQPPLICSNLVLNAALRKPEVSKLPIVQAHRDDPIGWLKESLIIDYPGDASILRVALRGEKPEQLPKVVNAVTRAYMDEIVFAGRSQRARQRDELDRYANETNEKIREKKETIHKLKQQLGFSSVEATEFERRVAVDRIDEILTLKKRVSDQLRDLEMGIRLQKKKDEDPASTDLPEYLIDAELSRDPSIVDNMHELTRLEGILDQTESLSANRKLPLIARLREQVDTLREKIADRKQELRPQLLDQIKRSTVKGFDLKTAESQREILEESLKAAQERLRKELAGLSKLDSYNSDLLAMTEELASLEKFYQQVTEELQVQTVEVRAKATQIDRNRVVEIQPATQPNTSNILQKYATVGFAGLLGFGVVLFGVAYAEFQARRLNSTREVNDGLGIAVMGELPTLSGRAWRRMQAGKDTQGALQALLTESIDSIRATLLYTTSVESPRVVMVTSAGAREGKTTVATQLAVSLARSGRRTLLVDGDLRSPTAHRVLEVPQEPGFSELLRKEVEREAVVHPTQVPNLWMLPAGRCNVASIQALATEQLTETISALRSQFEFIVMDSGPVLSVADPLLLGQHVDAVILSVLRDVSEVPKVYEASERLKAVGVVILGSVVNGGADRTAPQHAARQLAHMTEPANNQNS